VTLAATGRARTSTTNGDLRVVVDVTTDAPNGLARYTVEVFSGSERVAMQASDVSLK
jgi:hypothetical protein